MRTQVSLSLLYFATCRTACNIFMYFIILQHNSHFSIWLRRIKNITCLISYLNMWTFEFRLQNAFTRKTSNMEAITVWVANQDIASIWYINSIRKAGYLFIANSVLERSIVFEYCDTVAFEVAYVEVIICNKNVTAMNNCSAAIKC